MFVGGTRADRSENRLSAAREGTPRLGRRRATFGVLPKQSSGVARTREVVVARWKRRVCRLSCKRMSSVTGRLVGDAVFRIRGIWGESRVLSNHPTFIWSIADLLRGSFKAHQYGDVILPFTVLRRLNAVLATTQKAVLEAVEQAKVDGLPVRASLLRNRAGHQYSFSWLQRGY